MPVKLLLPPQPNTAPILMFSILLAVLFYPALERALESWVFAPISTSVECRQGSGTWHL